MEHGPLIDDLAIKDDDFPERYVKLPEGNPRCHPQLGHMWDDVT